MKIFIPNFYFFADRFKSNPLLTAVEVTYLLLVVLYLPIFLLSLWNNNNTLFIQFNVMLAIVSLLFFLFRYLFYKRISLETKGFFNLLMFSFFYTIIVLISVNTQLLVMLNKDVIVFFSGLILMPFIFVYLGLYRFLITKFRKFINIFLVFFLVLTLFILITDFISANYNRANSIIFSYTLLTFLLYSYNYDKFYKNYVLNFVFSILLFALASLTKDFNYFIFGFVVALFNLFFITKFIFKNLFIQKVRQFEFKLAFVKKFLSLQFVFTFVLFLLNIFAIFFLLIFTDVYNNFLVYYTNQLEIVYKIINFEVLILGYGITKYQSSDFPLLTNVFLVGGVLSILFLLYWSFSAVSTKNKLFYQLFQIVILFILCILKLNYLYAFVILFIYSLLLYTQFDVNNMNGFSQFERLVAIPKILEKTKFIISIFALLVSFYLFYIIDLVFIRV